MTTTTTTDARVRVYYKLTLWAWRLRWANKNKLNMSEPNFKDFLIMATYNAVFKMLKIAGNIWN